MEVYIAACYSALCGNCNSNAGRGWDSLVQEFVRQHKEKDLFLTFAGLGREESRLGSRI